ncbi:hypothetical protein E4T43_02469 [Aureobasidium subglaciale]|nr:hypothetical protein E4T43_02469 [Aureobasidium subglaciale]
MAVGSEGVIHLWYRIDPNTSKILERVIVKQVVSGAARFNNPRQWAAGVVGGQPMECLQMELVRRELAAEDEQYILKCFGWGGVDTRLCRYKLYLEYCDYGDITCIMDEQKHQKKPGKTSTYQTPWPEPFLWYLFRALAKICVAMDKTYGSEGMVHGWPTLGVPVDLTLQRGPVLIVEIHAVYRSHHQ